MRFQTEDSDGVVTQKTSISVTPAVTTLKGVFRVTLCPSFGPSSCLRDQTVITHITGVVSHDADYRKIFFFRLFPTMYTGCLDRYRTSLRLFCAW